MRGPTQFTALCYHGNAGVYSPAAWRVRRASPTVRHAQLSIQQSAKSVLNHSVDRGHDNKETHQEVGILPLTVVMTTRQHTPGSRNPSVDRSHANTPGSRDDSVDCSRDSHHTRKEGSFD